MVFTNFCIKQYIINIIRSNLDDELKYILVDYALNYLPTREDCLYVDEGAIIY